MQSRALGHVMQRGLASGFSRQKLAGDHVQVGESTGALRQHGRLGSLVAPAIPDSPHLSENMTSPPYVMPGSGTGTSQTCVCETPQLQHPIS